MIHQPILYWKTRLSTSDPGFIRLRFAANIVLTVFSACLVMLLLSKLGWHGNLTPVMLTGLVGLQANVIVNDQTERARKITTLLFPLASAISITLAAVFLNIGYHLSDIMLVIIVFLAFFIQRFGIRYFSFGMIGFLTFYFSLMYLQSLTFAQLPWYYLGIFVGTASAYIVNFFLSKEQPIKILKRSMLSYQKQTNITLDLIIEMIQDTNPNAGRVNNVTRNIKKLNEYARMAIGQFEATDPGKVWPGIQTNELRLYVFDAAMLIETLAPTVKKLQDLHALEKSAVRYWLLQIVQSLREVEILRGENQPNTLEKLQQTVEKFREELDLLKTEDPESKKWLYLLRRIESIGNHLIDEATTIQRKRLEHLLADKNNEKLKEGSNPEENETGRKSATRKQERHGLHPATIKGLQAALVSVIAIVFGHFLSPDYPYWAVLSANMIILGTETDGHSTGKAFQRIAGTVTGAIAGFVIGHFVAGQPYIAMLLLIMSIFMGYYLMARSYAVFIFWVTMLLAMTFELLLGGGIEQILVLRVIDTLIGAILSATAAAFLFPHKTTDKIRSSMIDFLSNLKEYVDSYLKKFDGVRVVDALAGKALGLDQKLQQIKNETDLMKRWPGSLSRAGIEEKLTVLTAINFYAKHLVASSNRDQSLLIDETLKQTIKHVGTTFEKNVDTLRKLLNEYPKRDLIVWELESDRELIERIPDGSSSDNVTQIQLIHDLDYVWNINQAITELACDLGAQK
ncbi:FUSC family protein [Bacillus sp. EB600]|uniref:FUSC family protein n=1 Tax=Bacillus sp. EB600 TaxID=2806345 RepID=UPI002108DF38|nr:FUSC family protein [Bacillus sp. EB600]MCQ6279964.1 FUSC family protein [Bacillus sp. EB600]